MKKIVAIGGGENGRIGSDGTRYPYETAPMDKEIIRLTGKEKPNFLLIAHSQPLERQHGYFETMERIYGDIYGCACKELTSDILTDTQAVQALIDWADIIYEGGGDTITMVNMWHSTGFDKILRTAWENGKVMCGVSAGANCWFTACNTDSLKIQTGMTLPLWAAVTALILYRDTSCPIVTSRKESHPQNLHLKKTALQDFIFPTVPPLP